MLLRFAAASFALAALALAGSALAQSQLAPSSPLPFETVNQRMTVDSCVFDASTVAVLNTAQGIEVRMRQNNCLVAGPTKVVDIRLGAYPVGSYRVVVSSANGDIVTPLESLRFEVLPRPEIAIYPPPAHPLTDYSGVWWNAQESGWGLSIHQSARDTLFAALFVYDVNHNPQWFTIQPGAWTSATRWTGIVYRTTGPHFSSPDYDPRLVLVQPVGNAVLDFEQAPGTVGQARFTYTIDGVATVKTIVRMAL